MISFQVISHFSLKLTDHGNTWPSSILNIICMMYMQRCPIQTLIRTMSALIDIGGHFA